VSTTAKKLPSGLLVRAQGRVEAAVMRDRRMAASRSGGLGSGGIARVVARIRRKIGIGKV